MRHAKSDFDQEVSIGKEQARAAGSCLLNAGIDPVRTLIIASEIPRAIRTAEIVKEVTGVSRMITRDALSDHQYEKTFSFLSDMLKVQARSFDAIIAVTHEPNMQRVLAAFSSLCGAVPPKSAPYAVIYRILPDEKVLECIYPPIGEKKS